MVFFSGGGGVTRNVHEYSRQFLESGRLNYVIYWVPVGQGTRCRPIPYIQGKRRHSLEPTTTQWFTGGPKCHGREGTERCKRVLCTFQRKRLPTSMRCANHGSPTSLQHAIRWTLSSLQPKVVNATRTLRESLSRINIAANPKYRDTSKPKYRDTITKHLNRRWSSGHRDLQHATTYRNSRAI